MGVIDKDGYLTIKGRDDFKIVTPAGEKIFARNLEREAGKDKRVADVCILGKRLPDGTRCTPIFFFKPVVRTKLARIVSEINLRLESKQQITSFALWRETDFPRTSTLKIDRKIVSRFLNEKAKTPAKKEEVKYQLADILDVVSRVSGTPREAIKTSDFLTTDLGLDSLSRVELITLTEEYLDILLDETKISSRTTVGDLISLAKNATPVVDIDIPTCNLESLGNCYAYFL